MKNHKSAGKTSAVLRTTTSGRQTGQRPKVGTLDMSRNPRPAKPSAKQPMGQTHKSGQSEGRLRQPASNPVRKQLTPNQVEQITREVEKEVPEILTALLSGKKPVKTKIVKLKGKHGKYPVKLTIR